MRKAALLLVALAGCASWRPRVQMPAPDPKHPLSALGPADDAPHPSSARDYFEWWYYDATFDDGSTATVALYAAAMFGRTPQPAVLVNLRDAVGTVRYSYRKSSLARLAFGRPGEIRVDGSSAARLPDGATRVQASGTDSSGTRLSVDLTFTPQMPGFKLGDGTVRLDGKVALAWVVPMPRARVTGTVREGKRERQVSGLGYHDHNWGELDLRDTMAYWYWGRIASPDTTLIYADVHFRPSLRVPRMAFVAYGDAGRLDEAFEAGDFTPRGTRFLDTAGRDVPRGLAVRAGPLSLELSEREVLESDDLSREIPWILRPFARLFAKPAYVRALSDYAIGGQDGGRPWTKRGSGAITEYMYVVQP